MDYLIYNTEQEAETAQDIIFEFGKALAAQAGYFVNGGIHGTRHGISSVETAHSERWDIPRLRLDSKWVVLHPKYDNAAQDAELLDALMLELEPFSVETEQPDWFPIEEVL